MYSVTVLFVRLQRSRHGSGTSMQSKRSDSLDSGTTSGNSSAAKLLSGSSLAGLQLRQLHTEESWHMELRNAFVALYIQYLQQSGAGFQQIQVVPVACDASASQRYSLLLLYCSKARVDSD